MELADAVFNLDYDGEDFKIPIYDGKVVLRGCEWRPETQPEFVLVYVHGLGSFLTAHHDFGDIIIDNNGAFLGCDHFGHGRSPGPRAACTVSEVVMETEVVIQKARESFPDIPIFISGISMGALAILQLVLEKPIFATQNLRGVILISPWISNSKLRPISFLQSIALMIAAKFAPRMIISKGQDSYSDDIRKDYTKLIEECPLHSPWTTPRLVDSALRSMTFVRKSHRDWPSELPVMFLQGQADVAVDPAANVAWFDDLKEASAKDMVVVKTYARATHNLLHCPYRAVALQDILSFINRHKQ